MEETLLLSVFAPSCQNMNRTGFVCTLSSEVATVTHEEDDSSSRSSCFSTDQVFVCAEASNKDET